MSWQGAFDECQREGGKLARVDNEEDNDTLYENFIKERSKSLTYLIWLGFNQTENEGDWVWQPEKEVLKWHKWADDQPDNWTEMFGSEDCGAMFRNKPYWNDDGCQQKSNSLCMALKKRDYYWVTKI